MKPIDLNPNDLETIKQILSQHVPGYEVRAFGSRVAWTASEKSDLDLVIMTDKPLDTLRMANLKEAFSESDLPIMVDVVDWSDTKEYFQKIIKKDWVKIQEIGWKYLPFGEVVDFNPKRTIKKDSPVKFVAMADIEPFKKKINSFVIRNFSGGSKFKNGDTLMARITPCLENGKTAFVDFLEKDEVAGGSTEFIVLSGKDKVSDSAFVYYLSTSPKIREAAIKAMTGTSGRQRVENDKLVNQLIELPPIEEQAQIAEILSSLDDKIELNRAMNANLEKIASSLFKHWFVDFEFPNEDGKPYKSSGGKMVDSEMGEIPEGWRVVELSDISDIIDCLHTKKPEKLDIETGRILLQLSNIGDDGLLDLRERFFISEIDYKKWISRMEATEGDCIITNVGRVGAFSRIPANINAALGRNMTGIRTKNNFPYKYFLAQYFLSDLYKSEISKNIDIGTILDALNVRNIPKLRLIVTKDRSILEKADDAIGYLWQLREYNINNNYYLAALRDSLLPRLMNGRIRVPGFNNLGMGNP